MSLEPSLPTILPEDTSANLYEPAISGSAVEHVTSFESSDSENVTTLSNVHVNAIVFDVSSVFWRTKPVKLFRLISPFAVTEIVTLPAVPTVNDCPSVKSSVAVVAPVVKIYVINNKKRTIFILNFF